LFDIAIKISGCKDNKKRWIIKKRRAQSAEWSAPAQPPIPLQRGNPCYPCSPVKHREKNGEM